MAIPVVRQARPEDLDALLELYRQLSHVPEPLNTPEASGAMRLMLGHPGMHLVVAELDGVVVGTVTVVLVPNLTHSARPWAQLENMVVHEDHRRERIGHRLIAHCEDITSKAGCYKVQLQSSHPRKAAHAFYEQEGFSPSSVGFRKYF